MMNLGEIDDHDVCEDQSKLKVLCIGMACVDFVNIVKEFPLEDSDQRIQNYYWQRGGNASNNCTVLSLISVPCEFMGILGNVGVEASWIKEDFDTFGIGTIHSPIKDAQCPVATIILNQKNGSRTILFFPRDRPELSYDDFNFKFEKDFSTYAWVHFEMCKNVSEISLMIDNVLDFRRTSLMDKPVISIEIEKPEFPDYGTVLNKADIVFLSKDYALSKGFINAKEAVQKLNSLCKTGAILVCAWGEEGAALSFHGGVITSPALTDIDIVDTLGAGDTFVSGFIGSLYKQKFSATHLELHRCDIMMHKMLELALQYACQLAGLKCSMYGYTGLKDSYRSILN
ncbi:hypothetical protein Btru_004211 [Bulinus truncatus]|nr:hypothetical protein Btru_004211 [Bulinus truncatus]